MAKLKRKKFKRSTGVKHDIIIKIGNFELYFENVYSIYSLINDLLIGILFIGGSLVNLFDGPARIGQVLYFIGSIALILRPLIKIIQNTHVYRQHNEDKKSKIEKKISKKIKEEEKEEKKEEE